VCHTYTRSFSVVHKGAHFPEAHQEVVVRVSFLHTHVHSCVAHQRSTLSHSPPRSGGACVIFTNTRSQQKCCSPKTTVLGPWQTLPQTHQDVVVHACLLPTHVHSRSVASSSTLPCTTKKWWYVVQVVCSRQPPSQQKCCFLKHTSPKPTKKWWYVVQVVCIRQPPSQF
jgi:hypothetical protein